MSIEPPLEGYFMTWFLGMTNEDGERAFVYRSRADSGVWLLLPDKEAFDKVPQDALADLGELVEVGMMLLRKGEHYIGMTASEAINNLRSKGYHLRTF